MSKMIEMMDVWLGIAPEFDEALLIPEPDFIRCRHISIETMFKPRVKPKKPKPVRIPLRPTFWAKYERKINDPFFKKVLEEKERYQQEINNDNPFKIDWQKVKLYRGNGQLRALQSEFFI